MTREQCDECRFDANDYTAEDCVGTLYALGPWWEQLTAGVDPSVLMRRPAAEVWSPAEYANHSGDVIAGLGRLVHVLLTDDEPRLPAAPPPAVTSASDLPSSVTAEAAIETLTANAARLAEKAQGLRAIDRDRRGVLGEEVITVGQVIAHAVHDATHHLQDAGRGIHALGAGAPRHEGFVAGLHRSDGGVPKRTVEVVDVGRRGVIGDRQATRRHHGRAWQALCLWSAEVIDLLRAEGHPIAPGRAGENVTLTGIDWSTMRAGVRVLIGGVLVELTPYALPCKKNAQWFIDGDFNRMHQDQRPAVSRIYAKVLVDGAIHQGDAVVIEPD